MNIKIDEEFKNLIPPLSKEEYQGLEDSLKSEGCREAIIVWNGTIVDGHNRYEICTKNGIAFEAKEKEFESKDKAKEWIIKNQFSRRNITSFTRARLALELKELISSKAREHQIATLKQNQETVSPTLAKR